MVEILTLLFLVTTFGLMKLAVIYLVIFVLAKPKFRELVARSADDLDCCVACESCSQGAGNPAAVPGGEYREGFDMCLCDVCYEEADSRRSELFDS